MISIGPAGTFQAPKLPNEPTTMPFEVAAQHNLLSAMSGRPWGILNPCGEWVVYGDLTPSECGNNLRTAMIRYKTKATAERLALKLNRRMRP